MKKIYSFIAVASLMLTSVLAFTSCQKDELPTQKTNTTNTTNNKKGANSDAVYVTVTSSSASASDKGTVDVNALLGKK